MTSGKRLDLFRLARGAGLLLFMALLCVVTFVPAPQEAQSAGQVVRALQPAPPAKPGDAGGVLMPGTATTSRAIYHPEKWGPALAVQLTTDKEEAALDARIIGLRRDIWAECLAATERRR